MVLNGTYDVLKLCDFGLSKTLVDSSNTMEAGTARYTAPEVLINRKYNEMCDVYSWTLTFWQCCTGEMPFDGCESMISICAEKAKPENSLNGIENASEEFNRVIARCSAHNPVSRMSMYEIKTLLENLLKGSSLDPETITLLNQRKYTDDHSISIWNSETNESFNIE